ncbi:hypothetical protein ILUMI_27188 [Ignelater luminosus]|uniref:Uncharacterized protein n=1 Tax=Ignelater luminosus TaxID=2038154 RepID=A0A8K0C3N6_IGNLU|nr:hypothetical protein ILUMI_27188 [Ignelater luminosus]
MKIRIEIDTNSNNDRRRGGHMDCNPNSSDRSEITLEKWRSGSRSRPAEPEHNRGGGFEWKQTDTAIESFSMAIKEIEIFVKGKQKIESKVESHGDHDRNDWEKREDDDSR